MPGAANVTLRWVRPQSAPTLVTAPQISILSNYRGTGPSTFGPNSYDGGILGVTPAVWDKEDGVELTGTITASDVISFDSATRTAVVYIGATPGVSSTTNEYQNWYLFCSGVTPYAANGAHPTYSAYCGIISYDGSTKRVTVNWETSFTGTQTWKLVKNYPVLRRYQWKRNGVPISGQNSRVYTIVEADVNQSITVEETAQFADWTWKQNGGALTTPPLPTFGTAAASNAYISTASFSSGTKITKSSDFAYIGSFKVPHGNDNAKIAIVPSSQSANGQTSISMILFQGINYEYSIPTITTSSTPSGLNTASVTRSSSGVDVYDGWDNPGNLGVGGEVIKGGQFVLPSSSSMIMSSTGYYTYNSNAYWVKRPVNITQYQSLSPFFIKPNAGSPRWCAGTIIEIPSALQSSLGGDLLVSSGIAAIAGNNSQSPAMTVINSSSIDSAISKYETGSAQSGSSTSAVLAVGASSTSNYYVGWEIIFSIGGLSYSSVVDTYNNSTKQITFANIGASVSSGTAYKLIAPVTGKLLAGGNSYEDDAKTYPCIWNTNGSFTYSAFIPRGTTSVVSVVGPQVGRNDYGLWATYANPDGRTWGGIGNTRLRMFYSSIADSFSPGPIQSSTWPTIGNNQILFWTYDVDELAAVNSGSKSYDQIVPGAIFAMGLPYEGSTQSPSAAFDNTNNRLYIYQRLLMSTGAIELLIHVYSCNKYV